jgi:hypothetical protein
MDYEAGGIIKALDARVERVRGYQISLTGASREHLMMVAYTQLASSDNIRLRPTPVSTATKLLIEQRQAAEDVMWMATDSREATEDKSEARKLFMTASKSSAFSGHAQVRRCRACPVASDVEANQGDSKPF